MRFTAYHAKYVAHDLTKQAPPGAEDQLSMSLFDASVDLNPHQIEAAMFALQSPLSEGAILADEVGLGKTIEAGIVLCQKWAERKRRLVIICPASIRQQWANELSEKFNLPAQVAWLWTRHQPASVLSQWFFDRVARNGGRMRKTTIVALARKLLVAFWKYVTSGVVIEGAVMQAA